jgi:hypothetical protein
MGDNKHSLMPGKGPSMSGWFGESESKEVKRLKEENNKLKNADIIEVMVINPRVDEWVKEKEKELVDVRQKLIDELAKNALTPTGVQRLETAKTQLSAANAAREEAERRLGEARVELATVVTLGTDVVRDAEREIHVERLAGNVVKEEFWKGEHSAARQILDDLRRVERALRPAPAEGKCACQLPHGLLDGICNYCGKPAPESKSEAKEE